MRRSPGENSRGERMQVLQQEEDEQEAESLTNDTEKV